MDTQGFSLDGFIASVEKEEGKPADIAKANARTLRAATLVFNCDEVTDEFLDQLTLEDLEWLFDMIYYWPTDDTDNYVDEDLNHLGYQRSKMITFLDKAVIMKSKKRKVSFI